MHGPKAGDQADHENQRALNDGDGRAAHGPSDHYFNAGYRSDQRLFQKAELAVPQHCDPGKDRGEQDRHADHAWRHKLQVASVAGFLKHRTQAETEHQKIEQRLAQRRGNLRLRTDITLQFAQPENINGTHRRPHIFATCRNWSAEVALSSRIDEPVNERNACSSDSLLVCCFSSCGVPWATMPPWSMTAMRWATRSASSM